VEGPLYKYHAALRGHTETAKALLELGATVHGLDPHATPLHTYRCGQRSCR
jgi:hypothetical protein